MSPKLFLVGLYVLYTKTIRFAREMNRQVPPK